MNSRENSLRRAFSAVVKTENAHGVTPIAIFEISSGELAQMVERSLSMREVRGSMPRFSIPDFQENVHFVIDKAPKSILHSTVDNIANFFAQLMRIARRCSRH